MHWLAQRLESVHQLGQQFVQLRAAPPSSQSEPLLRKARGDFHRAIQTLVGEVTKRPGVTACFAAHEGLVLAVAGQQQAGDQDAWAAMAQVCLAYSQKTAQTLSLGETRQIVIVGEAGKLVLFPIENMVLGVLSPTQVNLSQALAA